MRLINSNSDMSRLLFAWTEKFGWILVAMLIVTQPFRNLFELPMALMAIFGLLLLLLEPLRVFALSAIKPLLILFACIWLPMVASLPDAVNFSRAVSTTLVFIRFPLAAIFVIFALQNGYSRTRMLMLLGLVLGFFAIGKVFYALEVEHSLPGAMNGWAWIGRIIPQRGVGHLLAVLSPIYYYWIWQQTSKRPWIWWIAPIYLMAILLSGARVAWIMLAMGLVLLMLQLFRVERVKWHWKSLVASILLLGIAIGISVQNSALTARMEQTAGLFSGNFEKANAATSLRLPIWQVAIKVAEDHWINGIGPRGFRYIYPEYVSKDDFWLNLEYKDKTTGKILTTQYGPNHPHQFLLEIIAETGIIGVLGYLLALVYWVRLSLAAVRDRNSDALPWMTAAFIAIMPINAHMAFYASFWSCILWWLIAVSLAYWQVGTVRK
ncbi:MAG: O-antigen ligase family protein [Methylophilaceae bacterium]